MKERVHGIRLIQKGLKEIRSIQPGLPELQIIRSFFQAVAPFINIYMSVKIINKIVYYAEFAELVKLVLFTVFFNFFLSLLIHFLNQIFNVKMAEFDLQYEMRLNLKVANLDYVDVENSKTHMLHQKIKEIKQMNGGGIRKIIENLHIIFCAFFTIIFAIIMTSSLFYNVYSNRQKTNDELIAVLGIILPIFILMNVWVCMYANQAVTTKMYKIMNGLLPFNRVFGYYMDNYISAYHAGKDIRIYRQEKLIGEEMAQLFTDFRKVAGKLLKNQFKYTVIPTIAAVALSTLVYILVGICAWNGIFEVGMIVQYISSINELTNSFICLMGEIAKLNANNEALDIYFEFMEIPNRTYNGSYTLEKYLIDNKFEIEFRNVSFSYPNSQEYALKNVNMTMAWGKKMAIVGENGSGKTTLIKLLCRLYDPTEGEILLNGINIKHYSDEEYRRLLSVVFQDFSLFSFSLAENVATDCIYLDEKVEECLQNSGFGVRLAKLSNGIRTFLYKDFEEEGVEISGGEAQKIALARALYKEAPFIILDEPTAALDPITEAELYTNFNGLVANRTVIFISHRLSSCCFCDKIFVFDKGVLVQQGTHEDLKTENGGKYQELWNAQAQYYITKM